MKFTNLIRVVFLTLFSVGLNSQSYFWPSHAYTSCKISGTVGEYRNNTGNTGRHRFHQGVDFRPQPIPSSLVSRNVRAVEDGFVRVYHNTGAGSTSWIEFEDVNGDIWEYHHCDQTTSSPMIFAPVMKGDIIGRMVYYTSSSGNELTHLHLESDDNNLNRFSGFVDSASPVLKTNKLSNTLEFWEDGYTRTSNTNKLNQLKTINGKTYRVVYNKFDIEAHIIDFHVFAGGGNGGGSGIGQTSPFTLNYQLVGSNSGVLVSDNIKFDRRPDNSYAELAFGNLCNHPGNPTVHILTSYPYNNGLGNNDRYINSRLKNGIPQSWPQSGSSDYTNQDARINLQSSIKDGLYTIKVYGDDIAGNKSATKNDDIVVDNFKPHIQKVTVELGGIEYFNGEWLFNPSTEVLNVDTNYPTINGPLSNTNSLIVKIDASEELVNSSSKRPNVSLVDASTGSSYTGTFINSYNNNTQFEYSFNVSQLGGLVIDKSYTIEVCGGEDINGGGEDINGNKLLALNQYNHSSIPVSSLPQRRSGGVWSTPIHDTACDETFTFDINCTIAPFQSNEEHSSKSSSTCLEADFDFDVLQNGCSVSFEENSTGFPSNYTWYFGDGSISYEQNPTHFYDINGDYFVTLEISNSSTFSSITKLVSISFCDPFDDNYIDGCIISGPTQTSNGSEISFSVQPFGIPPFTYSWDVPGVFYGSLTQGTLSDQNISYEFDDGVNGDYYDFCCTVSDYNGYSETCCIEVLITNNPVEVDLVLFSDPDANNGEGVLCAVAFWDFIQGGSDVTFNFAITNNDTGHTDYHNNMYDYDLCWGFNGELPALASGNYTISVVASSPYGSASDSEDIIWGDYTPPPACASAPVGLTFYENDGTDDYKLEVGSSLFATITGNFNGTFVDCQNCFGSTGREYCILYKIFDGNTGDLVFEPWDQFDPNNYQNFRTNNRPFHLYTVKDGCDFQLAKNWGCEPGSYRYEFYIYEIKCTPIYDLWQMVQPYPSQPCPITVDYLYEYPSIVDFTNEYDCDNNEIIVEANTIKGCQDENSVDSQYPCAWEDQFYDTYTWKAYDYYSGSELNNLLNFESGSKCNSINANHEYFDLFEGETFSVFIELVVTDFANPPMSTSKYELVTLPKPVLFNVEDQYFGCSQLNSFKLSSGESVISTGVDYSSINFIYDSNYLTIDQNSNPEYPVFSLSGSPTQTTIQIEVLIGNCTVSKNVDVLFSNLGIDIIENQLYACTDNNSEQSILSGGANILNGSGDYSFEWEASNSEYNSLLSNRFEYNPMIFNPTNINLDYTLIVTDNLNGCTATDLITVVPSYTNIVAEASPWFMPDEPWVPAQICNGVELTLGEPALINGQEYDENIHPNINFKWVTDDPTRYSESESEYYIITEDMSFQNPGNYNFTLKVIDSNNGCINEDVFNLEIFKPILYTGFESVIQDILVGNSGLAWSSGIENKIILESENIKSSGQAGGHLGIEWNDDEPFEYSEINDLFNNYNITLTPTKSIYSLNLINGNGCKVNDISTDFFNYFQDFEPTIELNIVNGESVVCPGTTVCLEAIVDLNYYIPPQFPLLHLNGGYSTQSDCCSSNHHSGGLVFELLDSNEGIYKSTFCFDLVENSIQKENIDIQVNLDAPFISEAGTSIHTVDYGAGTNCSAFCFSWPFNQHTGILYSNFYASEIYLGAVNNSNACSSCLLGLVIAPSWYDYLNLHGGEDGRIEIGNEFSAVNGTNLFASLIPTTNPCDNGNYQDDDEFEFRSHSQTSIKSSEFQVIPNPFKDQFELRFDSNLDNTYETISVFNQIGEIIYQQNITPKTSPSIIVDLTDYPEGVYVLHLKGASDSKSTKLVKSK